jgi:hypothetical protein
MFAIFNLRRDFSAQQHMRAMCIDMVEYEEIVGKCS